MAVSIMDYKYSLEKGRLIDIAARLIFVAYVVLTAALLVFQ